MTVLSAFFFFFGLEQNYLEFCHPLFLLLIVEKAKMNFTGNENDVSPYVFLVS